MTEAQRLTCSGIARAQTCPGSLCIPWVNEPAGKAAHRGTAMHEYLAAYAECRESEHDEEWTDFCESANLSYLADIVGTPQEVAYSYCTWSDSARQLGQHLERAYPKVDNISTVLGTADLADPDMHWLADYKTGKNEPPPSSNPQLLTLGLSMSRVYDLVEPIKLELIYIRPTGYIQRVAEMVTQWDLDDWADELGKIMTRAKECRSKTVDSEEFLGYFEESTRGCRYCPGKKNCPIK